MCVWCYVLTCPWTLGPRAWRQLSSGTTVLGGELWRLCVYVHQELFNTMPQITRLFQRARIPMAKRDMEPSSTLHLVGLSHCQRRGFSRAGTSANIYRRCQHTSVSGERSANIYRRRQQTSVPGGERRREGERERDTERGERVAAHLSLNPLRLSRIFSIGVYLRHDVHYAVHAAHRHGLLRC